MFSFFKKAPVPLLVVRADGKDLCRIAHGDIPCELTPSVYVDGSGSVEFVDSEGVVHTHGLGNASGWAHFSVRVHQNLACQADCVISQSERFEADAFGKGEAIGIRFQPFFLSGAAVQNSEMFGKGLFARGLHFSGRVTPGNVLLSCECDSCRKSFLIHSYHAGFSDSGYFYSDSGKYTITVSNREPGSPAALSDPDPTDLADLEARLPLAPDGSSYRYLNPFRCPHCSAPYIDFADDPALRRAEYYGNYFAGTELLRHSRSEP
jgi:hypothetical protein